MKTMPTRVAEKCHFSRLFDGFSQLETIAKVGMFSTPGSPWAEGTDKAPHLREAEHPLTLCTSQKDGEYNLAL